MVPMCPTFLTCVIGCFTSDTFLEEKMDWWILVFHTETTPKALGCRRHHLAVWDLISLTIKNVLDFLTFVIFPGSSLWKQDEASLLRTRLDRVRFCKQIFESEHLLTYTTWSWYRPLIVQKSQVSSNLWLSQMLVLIPDAL